MKTETIYISLLNEGTDVWRPVDAEMISEMVFKIPITTTVPDDEEWMFKPGDTVKCQMRKLSGGSRLIAIEREE